MKTTASHDPVDMFWGYYDKLKNQYGDIEKINIDDRSRLVRFYRIMRYFLLLKLDIEEKEFNTFLCAYQRNSLK